jgi:hypothetical protein
MTTILIAHCRDSCMLRVLPTGTDSRSTPAPDKPCSRPAGTELDERRAPVTVAANYCWRADSAIGACGSLRNLFNWSLRVMAPAGLGWCQGSLGGDGNAVC